MWSTEIDGFVVEHNRILWVRHRKSTHVKVAARDIAGFHGLEVMPSCCSPVASHLFIYFLLGGPYSLHLFIYFSSGGLHGAHLFIYLFPGSGRAHHLFIYFFPGSLTLIIYLFIFSQGAQDEPFIYLSFSCLFTFFLFPFFISPRAKSIMSFMHMNAMVSP